MSLFVSGESARSFTVFTVNSTADTDDESCTTSAGGCTLREAINAANSADGPDEIRFNIPGAGIRQIVALGQLPTASEQVSILGLTQPSANCSPARNILIEIRNGGAVMDGLTINDSNSVVSGIAITGFERDLVLGGGGGHDIRCSNIGVDAAGTTADASDPAVTIDTADVTIGGSSNEVNLLGGDTAIVIGQVTGTNISNNRIGRQTADADFAPATGYGILIQGASSNTTITANVFGTFPDGIVNNPQAGPVSSVDIIENIFTATTSSGIRITAHEGGPILIQDCVFDGSGGGADSIQLDGDHSLTEVFGNTFDRPARAITLTIDGGATIGGDEPGLGNTFNGAGMGIFVIASSNPIPGQLAIRGNVISKGELLVINNARNGILIFADDDNNPPLDVLIFGNVITGMNSSGISVQRTGGVRIEQNFVGVTASGVAVPNGFGIQIALVSDPGTIVISGNTVSSNTVAGVIIQDSSSVSVQNNRIGIGPNDERYFTQPVGILMTGGSDHAINSSNTISYNTGPGISAVDTASLSVSGNTIAANGGAGILFVSTDELLIGSIISNTLTSNGGAGIAIVGPYNALVDVNIFTGNAGLAIDLGNDGVTANDTLDPDSGPNGLLNAPELSWAQGVNSVWTVHGTLHTSPSTTGYVDFYLSDTCTSNGFGQGRYIGNTALFQTDANGNFAFQAQGGLIAATPGLFISAVFRNGNSLGAGSSSEFSRCVLVVSESAPVLNQLSANSAKTGGDGFTMTLRGNNFAPDATGQWDGSPRQTTVVSAEELTIEVTEADLANVGIAHITVLNPAAAPLSIEQSNPLPFAVRIGSAADVNCSGYVDGVDALEILRSLAGFMTNDCALDADLDEWVTLQDARYVRLVAASLLPE